MSLSFEGCSQELDEPIIQDSAKMIHPRNNEIGAIKKIMNKIKRQFCIEIIWLDPFGTLS